MRNIIECYQYSAIIHLKERRSTLQLVLDKKYDDLDMLIEEAHDWDIDFRQMSTGGFCGRLIQSISPQVLISHARFDSKLHQEGSTPPGYRTFVVPCGDSVNFWWLGHNVTGCDMLVFPESRELECASNDSFEIFTISIEDSYLEALLQAMHLPRFKANTHVIRLALKTATAIRHRAMQVLRTHSTADSHALAEMIVSSRRLKQQPANTGKKRMRDQAITLIQDHLHDMPDTDLNISDMCRLANVSERTLQYAFKERYSVSPNDFVKMWRLNTARRLLLETRNTTISKVAEYLNFHHPSQFAADYRKLFGELPSQTLARTF